MIRRLFETIFFACVLLFVLDGHAQQGNEKRHIEVSMRMIGHQVLLSLGDSTTRVLPIEKDENSYKIRFEAEPKFSPDGLSTTIDSVIWATQIANRYIVEFVTCQTDIVAYSYEIGNPTNASVIPCGTRNQPKNCHYLLITLLDTPIAKTASPNATSLMAEYASGQYNDVYLLLLLLLAAVLIAMGVLAFILKIKSISGTNQHTVAIGDFRFNKRKMQLSFKDDTIELTSKECSLLQLLFESANYTVERDIILKMVWNDEGDYVGRTLDVFISKLRKKLEADANVKILNIRGIGYKLIVDIPKSNSFPRDGTGYRFFDSLFFPLPALKNKTVAKASDASEQVMLEFFVLLKKKIARLKIPQNLFGLVIYSPKNEKQHEKHYGYRRRNNGKRNSPCICPKRFCRFVSRCIAKRVR